ncbi:MAG: hypothetical protein WCE81_00710 [Halobacteriota archaeon]
MIWCEWSVPITDNHVAYKQKVVAGKFGPVKAEIVKREMANLIESGYILKKKVV